MARLQTLKINGLRNITGAQLEGFSRFNLFYGSNGAGKTSVLEAVHLLGLGRSFRMSRHKPLITYDAAELVVFGEIGQGASGGSSTPVGVRRARAGDYEIRLQGQRGTTAAELAALLPLQVINSETFQLVLGAPGLRRQFLDWGVFHVEHGFLEQWRRLQRSLKQRNSLLRHGTITGRELAPWDAEFLQAAESVATMRERYFLGWMPIMKAVLGRLWPEGAEDCAVALYPGWDKAAALSEVLARQYQRDQERGYTSMGPQRADMRITHRGAPVADVLSRGQLKLLSAAMRISQAALLHATSGKQCVFLVDDLPAELDAERRALLCAELDKLGCQVMITSIDKQLPERGIVPAELAMFHVEQGRITHQGQSG